MGAGGKMGGMELPEGGKQTGRDIRPDFRVEVVGSNPTGSRTPT